jgi:hypothetical protein
MKCLYDSIQGKTMVKEYVRSGPGKSPRRDCVLVFDPEKRSRVASTMAQRKIYQIVLLFKCEAFDHRGISNADKDLEGFILGREFSIGQRDEDNKMYAARKTEKLEVIPVSKIERSIHLIPRYGSNIGDTLNLKKRVQDESCDLITGKVTKYIDALSLYKDFWVNSWSDNHIYNLIW